MNKLVEAAQRYLEQRELPSNKFTDETELGSKLHKAGQKDGEAWCAYFVEVCLKDAFPEKIVEWDALCNASAVTTFNNFLNAAYPMGHKPAPGWLVAWQSYKDGVPGWTGHIGIVESLTPNGWISVEGNTSESGSREGVKVGRVTHFLPKEPVNNGLRLMGFIQVS